MRKEEMTWLDLLAEAVGIVSVLVYLGLQIYYGIEYGVKWASIALNVAMMVLVYAGFTLLAVYPERVNGFSAEVCTGKLRRLTIRMVRIIKLIFVESLLFASICDVMGKEANAGYSLVAVALIVAVALFYEYRIFRLWRGRK